MNNNKYPVNGTDNTDTMSNHFHGNWKSQGSNSHNHQNENQNTEQKATENTYDTISVITDTSFAQKSATT